MPAKACQGLILEAAADKIGRVEETNDRSGPTCY